MKPVEEQNGKKGQKLFYRPGAVAGEETEDSAVESSGAEYPFLHPRSAQLVSESRVSSRMSSREVLPTSPSMVRVPTYSSSIAASVRDSGSAGYASTCGSTESMSLSYESVECQQWSVALPHRRSDVAMSTETTPESPGCGREESHLIPGNWELAPKIVNNGSLSPGTYYPAGKRNRSHRYGAVRRVRRRAVLKNGECNILKSRISKRRLRFLQDIFTTLVDTQWRWTLLVFTLSFILSWLGFAVIWWLIAFTHGDLEPDHLPAYQADAAWTPCVVNIHSFTSCFLFSIETQHTIGYGSRTTTEECPEAIFIMCLQSITGVMIQAFMVGIVFAKMTRPKHRTQTLLFSKNAVICTRDSELCLMFRVGDMRKSHIIGAIVRAQLIRSRTTKEGEFLSQFQTELDLHADGCDGNLFFIWPITVVHKIDANSPLYNLSASDMLQERFEVVVILEGTIESTGQTTQARSSYVTSEILWGHRYDPMVSYNKERQGYEVDYSRFDETTQVDTPLCSGKELSDFYRVQDDYRPIGFSPFMFDHGTIPEEAEEDETMRPFSLRDEVELRQKSGVGSLGLGRISNPLVADAMRRVSVSVARQPSVAKYPSKYFSDDLSDDGCSSNEDKDKQK